MRASMQVYFFKLQNAAAQEPGLQKPFGVLGIPIQPLHLEELNIESQE